MNYVLVAILGPFAVAIGTVIQIHYTGRLRRQEKLEDWARQDHLRQLDRAEHQADTQRLEGKVDVIHELVNSEKTASLQRELVGLRGQVVLMKRVMALNDAAGLVTTADEHAALADVEVRAAEIQTVVTERLILQEQIDLQAAT